MFAGDQDRGMRTGTGCGIDMCAVALLNPGTVGILLHSLSVPRLECLAAR